MSNTDLAYMKSASRTPKLKAAQQRSTPRSSNTPPPLRRHAVATCAGMPLRGPSVERLDEVQTADWYERQAQRRRLKPTGRATLRPRLPPLWDAGVWVVVAPRLCLFRSAPRQPTAPLPARSRTLRPRQEHKGEECIFNLRSLVASHRGRSRSHSDASTRANLASPAD